MTENTHTPGPWTNNGGQIEGLFHCEDGYRHYLPIATVGEVNQQEPVDTANARLIAAAPELLAALRACEDRLSAWQDGAAATLRQSTDPGCLEMAQNIFNNYGALILQARAAIEKAS